MDRGPRQGDRQRRREDPHDRKPPRQAQDRSRSPAHRDQKRDDRRRERTPPPYKSQPRGGPPRRDDRDRDRNHDNQARWHQRRDGHTLTSSPPPQPASNRQNERGRQAGSRHAPDHEMGEAGRRTDGNAQRQTHGDDGDGDDQDQTAAMQKIMGFGAFRTTKNTKIPGNDRNYAVSKVKTTEYRQYMNRVGGFNRPLSPSR